jgi:N-acetylated-alpha-linked acidic dipeptidase
MGVSVRGKIAVARFGRSFRGIKAREAEKHGAVGLIMYSDPADDGYVRGDVYPEGPMRPAGGVQRGSVMNGAGDPSTPGWPSTGGARRIPEDSMPIPRIPVIPLGYGKADALLRPLRGTRIPAGWQGGLGFRYHVGPGPVRARLEVRDDRATRAMKPIWNTLATIRGSERPDEIVVIGAHRDSWSPGAADNVSGTVSVLEAARTIAALARAGQRPRRTIVFATWDAEEWGLIGSTEHVEDDSLRLRRGGVAYLNQDVAAQGVRFGGGGSPSLRALLRDVARSVPDPNGRGSVYAEWRRQSGVAEGAEPAMGDPGGGSDFAGFYNHLGIPHADWGFGGAGGIYHSQYDGLAWMRRFGDTSYAYHAAAARIAAAMALRLANAEVLPYDYDEFARTMTTHVAAIDRAVRERGWGDAGPSTSGLRSALATMGEAARRFHEARDARLASGASPDQLDRANAALLRVERALTRPEGLRTRPWYRNLVYVADENNGYSTMVFPSVLEAVRAGDRALASREMADLVARFGTATAAIEEARAALR